MGHRHLYSQPELIIPDTQEAKLFNRGNLCANGFVKDEVLEEVGLRDGLSQVMGYQYF